MKTNWMMAGLVGLYGMAQAAVVAEYTFNLNLNNSAGAGFAMSEIDSSGSYVADSVWSESKQVLSLSGLQGLNIDMSAWSGSSDAYTVVMDVNLSQVSSYDRMLSFDAPNATLQPASDVGFYVFDHDLVYYSPIIGSLLPNENNVSLGTWTRLAVSRSGNDLSLYVGTPSGIALTGSQSVPDTYSVISDYLSFFRDDSGENYDLKVSSIWVSDTAMSASEIEAIPEPATALSLFLGGLLVTGYRRICKTYGM